MRFIKNDYDSETTTVLTQEQYEDMLNDFDREKTVHDVSTRVEYARLNPDDRGINQAVEMIDPSRTIVMHFDSECDVFIEA